MTQDRAEAEPAVILRPARVEDSAALAILFDQLGYPGSSADDIAGRFPRFAAAGYDVLVAEIAGRVVGCLTTSIMPVLHRPKPVGRISALVVAEGLRGRRIGERLVRAAEELLLAKGCGLVEVTSNVALVDAHRFYERLGYQRTSHRFGRDPAGD